MLQITDVPAFRYKNQKVMLPKTDNVGKTSSLIYLLTKSPTDCEKLVTHPLFNRLSNWRYIYREYKFKTKLFNRNIIVNNMQERNTMLDKYNHNIPDIRSTRTIGILHGKNCYIDAAPFLAPFFQFKKKYWKLVIENFIDLLKFSMNYNDYFRSVKNKTVFINAEGWIETRKSAINSKLLGNPISILYLAMKKDVDLLKTVGDVTFVIIDGNSGYFTFNTNQLTNQSYIKFRTVLNKLKLKGIVSEKLDNDAEIEKENESPSGNKKAKLTVVTLADTSSKKDEDDGAFEDEETTASDTTAKPTDDEEEEDEDIPSEDKDESTTNKKSSDDVDKDIEAAINAAYDTNNAEVDKAEAVVLQQTRNLSAREKELIAKQKKVKVENRALGDILNSSKRAAEIQMSTKDIGKIVKTLNSNMTKVSFNNFEKTYNKNVMERDMLTIFNDLSKKNPPLYIRKITKTDTSTTLDAKFTYAVYLEDNKRRSSVFRFDYPKFIDNKFMYLAGNKKMFVKQLILKPLVKIAPDTVQICTNYNKIFMYREGIDVSPRIDNFLKIISANPKYFKVVKGNATALNKMVKTTIEYDSIANNFVSIELRNRGITFYFDQTDITKIINNPKNKIKNKSTLNRNKVLIIGFKTEADGELTPLTIDPDDQSVTVASFSEDKDIEPSGQENGNDVIDVFIAQSKEVSLDIQMPKSTIGKRYVYSRCSVMRKRIPTVILLGYFIGLQNTLNRANVKYKFSNTRPKLSDSDKMKLGIVQFANGYLSFERYPIQNSLLLNAFSRIDTRAYNFEDLDKKSTYVELFNEMFNQRILAGALDAYYDNMIDGITKELLEDADYPTDIVGLILAGNGLLADNTYHSEIDMHMFRVRSNEMTNAILYKIVATAYSKYKRTAMNKNGAKMSIPTDLLIRELKTSQAVEDYSKLNPITELEKSNAITSRGPSGINVDEAYTQDKRSYHPTMMGVMAISSSPDANVGLVRELTFEPRVKGARGTIEVSNDDPDKLNDANLFSATELLSPPGVTTDDSIRTAMAYKQSKQIVPVVQSDPVLISNGAEKTMAYRISNDYTIIAQHDGSVESIDEKNHIIVLKYNKVPIGEDDHQVIDTAPQIDKNGAGGFYLSSNYKTDLKVGSKFKKDTVIAYNDKFFSKHMDGVKFNIGTLAKVACMSNYNTYEDSTIVSKKLSEQMASEVVMQKAVVLNKDANIIKMVRAGQAINVGQEIISFEQGNEEDSTVNKLLEGIGDELKDEIKNLTRTSITSKYTGVIEDVKIYCVSELKELSPSIRTIVSQYYKKERDKVKYIKEYKIKDPSNMCNLYTANYDKVDTTYDKIKGNTITSGVLIEFYIKYFDRMSVGDKLVNYTALKGVITELFPEGKEPFSTFRPNEEISTVFPPGGTLARMVPSALMAAFVNKLLIELKRKLATMYLGKEYDYSHDFDLRK